MGAYLPSIASALLGLIAIGCAESAESEPSASATGDSTLSALEETGAASETNTAPSSDVDVATESDTVPPDCEVVTDEKTCNEIDGCVAIGGGRWDSSCQCYKVSFVYCAVDQIWESLGEHDWPFPVWAGPDGVCWEQWGAAPFPSDRFEFCESDCEDGECVDSSGRTV